MGKTNVQLIASVENQDRAKCGKNETGGMISSGHWARKHVGNRVQKIVMCTCITDFAISPAINPTRMYQIK